MCLRYHHYLVVPVDERSFVRGGFSGVFRFFQIYYEVPLHFLQKNTLCIIIIYTVPYHTVGSTVDNR